MIRSLITPKASGTQILHHNFFHPSFKCLMIASIKWKVQSTTLTESHSHFGWKGPCVIIWFKHPAQAGSATAGCPGPCPAGF